MVQFSLTKDSDDSKCNCQKKCFAKVSSSFFTEFWDFFQVFINTRCSENSLFVTNCYVGLLVILMQMLPMILQNWIYIIEPRTINMTDDKGEQMVWSLAFYSKMWVFYRRRRFFIQPVTSKFAALLKAILLLKLTKLHVCQLGKFSLKIRIFRRKRLQIIMLCQPNLQ